MSRSEQVEIWLSQVGVEGSGFELPEKKTKKKRKKNCFKIFFFKIDVQKIQILAKSSFQNFTMSRSGSEWIRTPSWSPLQVLSRPDDA